MLPFIEEEVKNTIKDNDNLSILFEENYIPLSARMTKNVDNIFKNFKSNSESNYIFLESYGNGLYHVYLYRFNKKIYQVCIWGEYNDEKKQTIQYIKDLECTFNIPKSPIPKKTFNDRNENNISRKRIKII